MDELTFRDADDVEVFYRQWLPEGPVRGAVVVAHGASEHSGRYARLADVLTSEGFAVYALDHRGHGHTAKATGTGRLGPRGMDGVLDDVGGLIRRAREESGGRPVVLLGHSMGSLIAQAYVEERQDDLAGLVLSGTMGPPPPEMAEAATAVEGAVAAGMGDEPIDLLAMNNAPFEPARTRFDWLSRDPAEVDAYINDPFCGDNHPLTFSYALGVLGVARTIAEAPGIAKMPKDLPILLITGESDTVSNFAAQVRELETRLRDADLDVVAHYYPEARHEVLNETNRDAVHADVVAWLDRVVPLQ